MGIVRKDVELCDGKKVAIRGQREQRACCHCVEQSRTASRDEGTHILENAPKQLSASKIACRLVKRRIVRHSSPLLNWHRGRSVGCVTYRVSKGITHGGEVVVRMDQGTVEERIRPGVCKEMGRTPHRIQYGRLEYRRKWATMQIQSRFLGK